MTTIKAYTSVEQSRKLAKILPIESADMYYREWKRDTKDIRIANVGTAGSSDLPCWSLAALFDVLPNFIGDYGKCLYCDVGGFYCGYMVDGDFMLSIEETKADNQVDACYEMILRLHKLELL